jgi:Uma2 family endonuclease
VAEFLRLGCHECISMNQAEFLSWEEQQTERHEFARGEIFRLSERSARHNRVTLNLAALLSSHSGSTDGQVFANGMRLAVDEDVFYPDVLVACGKSQAGDESRIDSPMLIVEVLAQGTGLDQEAKFEAYRRAPSLQEFVLINPVTRAMKHAYRSGGESWQWNTHTGPLRLRSLDASWPAEAIFKGVE